MTDRHVGYNHDFTAVDSLCPWEEVWFSSSPDNLMTLIRKKADFSVNWFTEAGQDMQRGVTPAASSVVAQDMFTYEKRDCRKERSFFPFRYQQEWCAFIIGTYKGVNGVHCLNLETGTHFSEAYGKLFRPVGFYIPSTYTDPARGNVTITDNMLTQWASKDIKLNVGFISYKLIVFMAMEFVGQNSMGYRVYMQNLVDVFHRKAWDNLEDRVSSFTDVTPDVRQLVKYQVVPEEMGGGAHVSILTEQSKNL